MMVTVRRRRWAVVAVVDVAAERKRLLQELQRRMADGNPFDGKVSGADMVKAVDVLNRHKGELEE